MEATLSAADHEIRSRGIGSSEIAAIVGENPWSGPHDIWRKKTGRSTGSVDTDRMIAGRYLEPAIIGIYSHITGATVEKPPTRMHPALPYIVDSVDGIATMTSGERRCVEAKATHRRNMIDTRKWGRPGTDEIPPYYLLQCQWHLGVHGLSLCDVPVWDGDELRVYTVAYDEHLFNFLADKARHFWETYVIPGVEPPLDGTSSCTDFINRITKKTDATVEADKVVAEALRRYSELHESIKNMQAEMDAAANAIKAAIGGAKAIRSGEHIATWGEVTRKGTLSSTKLAEITGATAEQIAQATSPASTYRRFIVKEA